MGGLEVQGLVAVAGGWTEGSAGLRIGPLSFSVPPGRCVAICGPSGSGKTTLLRALAALTRPAQGRVELAGRTALQWGVPQYRRRVSYLAQRPSLGDGTVRAALQHPFGFASAGTETFDEARAQSLVTALSLPEDILERAARELSAGEGQRINFIRALGLKPEILLADEPTSALDPATGLALEAALRTAMDNGLGVVLVSHDPEQRLRLANETVTLS